MGRGDKRSFKGKVFKGSFGKTRLRKKKKPSAKSAAGMQKKK
jgi:ribosomal small subunit protein bTHX